MRKRTEDLSVWVLTAKLVLVAWLFMSFTSMALLGSAHTAAVWCRKYSVAENPACRLVNHVLVIEGH
ncbi:hypothetical protein IGS68_31610 (plasmid) [Skermanella sp. TT6]|uniref:Uncharacterized protein n=1 Tax=Skermanella cutis TaxID=2775420 RepID=A0ABX7BK12_9PROT|nr:hypothetical protein [Skermanella sp. TT6]QQP93574.1 hypothetical protein IGS68_31610 [Skermanella sp. TT6]